jgi:hypothetical protein
VPLEGPAGEGPVRLPFPGDHLRPTDDYLPGPVLLGDRIVTLDPVGNEVGRAPATTPEEFLRRWEKLGLHDRTWHEILSLRLPVDLAHPTFLFRVFRSGEPPVSREGRLVMKAGAAGLAVAAVRLPLLLLPPALNAVSFASPAPMGIAEYYGRWWGDPLLGGGRQLAWLLASIGLGLLCAGFAWRSLRHRLTRGRLAWSVAALLLGPLGLVWMAAVLPREHVEACACGRRRAVSIETCPACRADWPGPEPTGAEVFV